MVGEKAGNSFNSLSSLVLFSSFYPSTPNTVTRGVWGSLWEGEGKEEKGEELVEIEGKLVKKNHKKKTRIQKIDKQMQKSVLIMLLIMKEMKRKKRKKTF